MAQAQTDRNDKTYLIDGSGYIYRAFYAVRPLSTSKGVPTNAVVGFARMLAKLLREERPRRVAMAFDPPGKTFRHEMYNEYKANRDAAPEDLVPQFQLIRNLVKSMDLPQLEVLGYEADDVIATATKIARAAGHNVVIVSGDKDLMQLVGTGVVQYDPMKNRRYGENEVMEKFGVMPHQVVDFLALTGDTSDNIPGVPKVGPKSAAKLLAEFQTLDTILEQLPSREKPKAFERSVIEHRDKALLSRTLVTLDSDVRLNHSIDELEYAGPDTTKLGDFLHSIEAFSLLRDFAQHDIKPAPTAESLRPTTSSVHIDRSRYRTIFTIDELDRLLEGALAQGELALVPFFTAEHLSGVAFASRTGPSHYLPLGHRYLGAPEQLTLNEVRSRLSALLSDSGPTILGHDHKHTSAYFMAAHIELPPIPAHRNEDVMLAAYVTNPSRGSFSIDALGREEFGHEAILTRDIMGEGRKQRPLDETTLDIMTPYAGEKADLVLQLHDAFVTKLKAIHATSVYREMELPLWPVLLRMEQHGILVDTADLSKMSSEFAGRLATLEKEAHQAAGKSFNLGSPKQLGQILFEHLKLPVGKKTKTGYSTDHEVLDKLAQEHALPRLVLEHRGLAKLKSTYVDALGRLAGSDPQARVHTTFNQTGAATGRLSSQDPNLQNIPIRSPDGGRIRRAFVAAPHFVLISADYSQVELRMMAHLSKDPRFIEAFEREEDIHSRTAAEVLTDGAPPSSDERRQAKAINFGILYGLSEFGLSKQLGISRAHAKRYISTYFARYPLVRSFLDDSIEQAKTQGFVTTITGRRRYLPDINSRNGTVRQGAERIAMNTPIQGSAADLMKLAMLKVHHHLPEGCRLLLQVHDELLVECPDIPTTIAAAKSVLRREMTEVLKLAVPLQVDCGSGPSWGDAH